MTGGAEKTHRLRSLHTRCVVDAADCRDRRGDQLQQGCRCCSDTLCRPCNVRLSTVTAGCRVRSANGHCVCLWLCLCRCGWSNAACVCGDYSCISGLLQLGALHCSRSDRTSCDSRVYASLVFVLCHEKVINSHECAVIFYFSHVQTVTSRCYYSGVDPSTFSGDTLKNFGAAEAHWCHAQKVL